MKEDRIVLRANSKEKQRIVEAATLAGMSTSSFLRQAALKQTNEILKNRDSITLSDRDRDIFLNALENPPKPNKNLQMAFKIYKKTKKQIKNKQPKKAIPKKK